MSEDSFNYAITGYFHCWSCFINVLAVKRLCASSSEETSTELVPRNVTRWHHMVVIHSGRQKYSFPFFPPLQLIWLIENLFCKLFFISCVYSCATMNKKIILLLKVKYWTRKIDFNTVVEHYITLLLISKWKIYLSVEKIILKSIRDSQIYLNILRSNRTT